MEFDDKGYYFSCSFNRRMDKMGKKKMSKKKKKELMHWMYWEKFWGHERKLPRLKNNTFQNIGLIEPKYFGVCQDCNDAWLLHRKRSLAKSCSEWICPYCDSKLTIKTLGKMKSVIDMRKRILRFTKGSLPTFGIFK